MSTKKEIWRLLEPGTDRWKDGDEWLSRGSWFPSTVNDVLVEHDSIGRRRMTLPEPQGWISVKERMPTKEDANKQGKVLWWDGHNAVSDRIGYAAHATHWGVLSDAPMEEDPDEEAFEKLWKEGGGGVCGRDAARVFFLAGRKSVTTEKEGEV